LRAREPQRSIIALEVDDRETNQIDNRIDNKRAPRALRLNDRNRRERGPVSRALARGPPRLVALARTGESATIDSESTTKRALQRARTSS